MNPLTYHLRDYLHEDLNIQSTPTSLTTLMHHGQAAQQWLLTEYLGQWLKLVEDLLACDYPLARKHARLILGLGALGRQLPDPRDEALQVFFLEGIQGRLKDLGRGTNVASARSMQWGVWARDVPTAIADAFGETDVLDPLVCRGVAPCCMYAAFVVSQIVTDEGVAEEIAQKMFEDLPRELLRYLDRLPAAPEA